MSNTESHRVKKLSACDNPHLTGIITNTYKYQHMHSEKYYSITQHRKQMNMFNILHTTHYNQTFSECFKQLFITQ